MKLHLLFFPLAFCWFFLSFVDGKNNFICHQRDPECVPSGIGDRHICTYDWNITQQNTMRLTADQMPFPPPTPVPGFLDYEVHYPIQKEVVPGEWTKMFYNFCDMDVYNRSAEVCDPEKIYIERNDPRFIGADGFLSTRVFAVNGKLPAPTICVHWRDTIKVNAFFDIGGYGVGDMTIHWHGMFQRGTPWMDGVPNVAQCPITPGEHFTYEFEADPAGSFWYHSHVGLQYDDGIFGALIILDENELYEMDGTYTQSEEVTENILMVGDWDHENAQTVFLNGPLHFISDDGTPFQIQQSIDGAAIAGTPFESSLINGYGSYTNDEGYIFEPWVFRVPRNEKVRFRLVSVAGDFGFRLSIDSHVLKIIAMDGFDIFPPKSVEAIIIYPAERYDFVIETSVTAKDNFWIRLETLDDPVINNAPQNPETKAILSYSDAETVAKYVAGEYIEPPLLSSMTDDFILSDENCNVDHPCTVMNCPWPDKYIDTEIYCITPGEQRRHPDEYNERPNPPDVDDAIEKGNIIYLNYNVLAEQVVPDRSYTNKFERPNIDGIWNEFPAGNLLTEDLLTIPNSCPNDEKLGSFESCVRWTDLKYDETYVFVLTNRWPQSTTGVGNFPGFMPHPSHMHGHSFYILAESAGQALAAGENNPGFEGANGCRNGLLDLSRYCYDEFTQDFNLVCTQGWGNCTFNDFDALKETFTPISEAPRKDTIVLPPHGYVVIAIRADNPGWWIWHCHIENHLAAGMALVLNEAYPEQQELLRTSLPLDFPTCGNFKNIMPPPVLPLCNLQTNECDIVCKADVDCMEGYQCCLNGCGQSCQILAVRIIITFLRLDLLDVITDLINLIPELLEELNSFLEGSIIIHGVTEGELVVSVDLEINIPSDSAHTPHELFLALKHTLYLNFGFDPVQYPILNTAISIECVENCPDEDAHMSAIAWLDPISSYFEQEDIDHMMFLFDLSNYYDVVANAHVILSVVESGQMPPEADRRWSVVWVTNFNWWIKNNYPYGGVPPPPPNDIPEAPAVIDLPGPEDVQLRLEYNTFSENEIQRSLFLQSFSYIQNMELRPDGGPEKWSWEAIARIHGEPSPWYCIHGAPAFPSWHRPYVMLFETAIRKAAQTLLGPNQGADWDAEYNKLRVPFWDWGGHTADGTPFTAPDDFITPEVTVLKIRSTEYETIINPFFNYTSKGQLLTGTGDGGVITGTTVRYITPPQTAESRSNNAEMAQSFVTWNPQAQQLMADSMKDSDYNIFATTQFGGRKSMENPHNLGHLIIGGGYYDPSVVGQMSLNTVAGYEPLFFMHHSQVERLLVIWQSIYENYNNENSIVTPFVIEDGSAQGIRATNENTEDFENFGYTYPMAEDASTPQELLATFLAEYDSGKEDRSFVDFVVDQINPDLTETFGVEIHAVQSATDLPVIGEGSNTFVGSEVLFTGGTSCTNCDPTSTSAMQVEITEFLEDRDLPLDEPLFIWARVFDLATGEILPLKSVCVSNPFWVVEGHDAVELPIAIRDITTGESKRFHCDKGECAAESAGAEEGGAIPSLESQECVDCEDCEECDDCNSCCDESVGQTQAFMSPQAVALSVVGVGLLFLAVVLVK